jgi:hypothetical protein
LPFFSYIKDTWLFVDTFSKNSHIKFHENPSRFFFLHWDRRRDMTVLMVAFCNFANASKDVSDKICRENRNAYFNVHWLFFYFLKSYRLWDNVNIYIYIYISELDRPQMIWRLRFACLILKSTNTNSVRNNSAFPL